jgi:hypothetical protein
VKLSLRFPATADHARDHARLAVTLACEEYDLDLDFSPESLAGVDAQIEGLRDDGVTGEEAGEALFVLGCYLGEVIVRHLQGRWVSTSSSPLKDISPWPMVVVLADGAWDPIGKVYRRLELGDSEYLPVYYSTAAGPSNRA